MKHLRIWLRLAGFLLLLLGGASLYLQRITSDYARIRVFSETIDDWVPNPAPRTFDNAQMSAAISQAASEADKLVQSVHRNMGLSIRLVVAGGLLLGIVSFFPTKKPD